MYIPSLAQVCSNDRECDSARSRSSYILFHNACLSLSHLYTGHTSVRPRKCGSRLSQSAPTKWRRPQLGLRSHVMPKAPDLPGMPAALQADINLGHAHHVSTDRGSVQRARKRTTDTQGRHFIEYLTTRGVDEHNIGVVLAPTSVIHVLKAYILQVALGNNCLNKKDLDDQTLRGYLNAAANEIARIKSRSCSIMDPTTLHIKRPTMHPYLCDIIQQCAT
jgi:hypothetical protein